MSQKRRSSLENYRVYGMDSTEDIMNAVSIWEDVAEVEQNDECEKYFDNKDEEGEENKDEEKDEEETEKQENDEEDKEEEEEESKGSAEELGEAYEEIPLSPLASMEKFEEEARQKPMDRETTLVKLRELLAERGELRRRNRLLEFWVFRQTSKGRERTPGRMEEKPSEELERIYLETLKAYKLGIDETAEEEARLKFQVETAREKVRSLLEDDERSFSEFLDRERELAAGLIFAKSGRRITERMIRDLTHRQVSRRDLLSKDRYTYILLQHRLSDLLQHLRDLETLGEGMTAMDYEVLRVANTGHKDKLDERNQELEKLRIEIETVVNTVAHYRETEACLEEDIDFQETELTLRRDEATEIRSRVNELRLLLKDLRETYNGSKQDAGLLIARPMLREMERTMKSLDTLRRDADTIERQIR